MTSLGHNALDLAQQMRVGALSPQDVMNETLNAAHTIGQSVGAFIHLDDDGALAHADAATQQLAQARSADRLEAVPPLLGVPCPIKDLTAVAGMPLRGGSVITGADPVHHDDGIVTRLRDAGTIPFGKTTTPEFGLPCYTEPDIGPSAVTPWDLSRSAGGSSGGAAAAVAAGIVAVAHGSDGGGSLRIPASACGVVGFKPSRGLISPGPHGLDGFGLVSHGVLTRTVADTAAFVDVLAGPWPGDAFQAPSFNSSLLASLNRPIPRLRIGVLTTALITETSVDPACLNAVDETVETLSGLGYDIRPVSPPFAAERWQAFVALWSVGALSVPVPPDDEPRLTALTRWLRELGRGVTGLAYAQAVMAGQQLTREIARAWDEIDVIISPTLAQLPAPIGSLRRDHDPAEDFNAQTRFTPWTSVWNITGWPSISLPLSMTTVTGPDGVRELPIGVMLGARWGMDDQLLALSAVLERAMPWSHRRPPVWAG